MNTVPGAYPYRETSGRLLTNNRLGWKVLPGGERSSLFGLAVSDEGEKSFMMLTPARPDGAPRRQWLEEI